MSAAGRRMIALAHAVAIETAHARSGNGYDAERVVLIAERFDKYLEAEPRPRDAQGRFTPRS